MRFIRLLYSRPFTGHQHDDVSKFGYLMKTYDLNSGRIYDFAPLFPVYGEGFI